MFQKYHSIHAKGEDVAVVLRDAAAADAAAVVEREVENEAGSEDGEITAAADVVVPPAGDERNGIATAHEISSQAPVPMTLPQGLIAQCKSNSTLIHNGILIRIYSHS